jgi:hypothetical protein
MKKKTTQERALRFVYNNYTSNYEELLHLSKLSSQKVRRLSSIALETFKIINTNCPSYLYDLINIKKHQYSFRYSNTTELPQVRTIRYGINSFRYTASKLWNELPEHFRNETNVSQFSKLISTWTGNSCHCNACK